MPASSLLLVDHVSIDNTSVDNLSFEINQGEVLGILGGTSTGKSSIIYSILGMRNYHGKIIYRGIDIQEWDKDRFYKEVFLVPERPEEAYIANTVANEVAYQLEEQGMPPEEIKKRVDKSLQVLGLQQYAWHSIHELSGGLKKRVVLASALAANPNLVLMDSPFSDLDPPMRRIFSGILTTEMRNSGVLITGSKRRELVVADKIIRLKDKPLDINAQPFLNLLDTQASILRVQRLVYWYKSAKDFMLDNVSIEHGVGEPLVVLGRNGAGKTTLGKLLAGIMRPRSGTIVIDNDKPGYGVSTYVYQDPDEGFIGSNIVEDLALNLRRRGMDKKTSMIASKEILANSGFTEHLDKPIFRLSRGVKKIYSLLSSLALSPRLVVLDEPTNNIDENIEETITSIVKSISKKILVIVITHDLEFAYKLGGHALILENGKVKFSDKTRRVKLEDLL